MYEDTRQFLQDIKEGHERGALHETAITDTVQLHISVGDFRYGHIQLNVLVDDERVSHTSGMYYRRLYSLDTRYRDIRQDIVTVVESENEHVENAHEWTATDPTTPVSPFFPESFDQETTVCFEGTAVLRGDVSMFEALATNRNDERQLTRTQIEQRHEEMPRNSDNTDMF